MQSVTVRRKLSSIAHLYKWMRRSGLISHNPVLKVQLPKIPVRLPKSLPMNVMKQLWDAITPIDDNKYNLVRDQAMIGLLYGCGLRRSEIIKAAWGDFDFQRQVLRIEGKGRKFRMVPVNDHLVAVLKKLRNLSHTQWGSGNETRIILMDSGKPCYPKYVHNKVIELIGTVSTAENKSPHVLRHSMATHLMDQGAELNAVKGILGHASLAATQVYTHNSISRLKEVYRQAHPKSLKDG